MPSYFDQFWPSLNHKGLIKGDRKAHSRRPGSFKQKSRKGRR